MYILSVFLIGVSVGILFQRFTTAMLTSKRSTTSRAAVGIPPPKYKTILPPKPKNHPDTIVEELLKKGRKEGKTEKEIVEMIETELKRLENAK